MIPEVEYQIQVKINGTWNLVVSFSDEDTARDRMVPFSDRKPSQWRLVRVTTEVLDGNENADDN